MNALTTRYSTTLLPLLVALAGVFTTAADSGAGALFSVTTIVQAVLLLASTGTDYWLPLVDARWRGAAKTGASIVFVGVSAAVTAWAATDGHVSKANVLLLITAIVKALVTEVATWIRVDAKATIDATSTADGEVPVITSLATVVPVPEVNAGSNLTSGDNLGGSTITSAEDAERARVERGEQAPTGEHVQEG